MRSLRQGLAPSSPSSTASPRIIDSRPATSATLFSARVARRVFTQALDRHPLHLAQGHVGEAGQDVVAQVAVVGVPGDGADVVGLRPHLHPLADGGLGEAGVDEEFSSLIGFHVRGAPLGVRAGGEASFGEQRTVGESVADSVSAAAFFCPCHIQGHLFGSGQVGARADRIYARLTDGCNRTVVRPCTGAKLWSFASAGAGRPRRHKSSRPW